MTLANHNIQSLLALLLVTTAACAHQTENAESTSDEAPGGGGASMGKSGGASARAGQPTTLPPAGGGKGGAEASSKGGASASGGRGGAATGGEANGGGASGGGGSVNMPVPGISVRFKSDDANTATPVSAIQGEIHIVNSSGQPLQLSDLSVRYYLTNEMTIAPAFQSRWGQLRSNNSMNFSFSGSLIALPTATAMADSYIEFAFNEALVLDMGKTAVASFQIRDPDGQQKFNQENDYSFSPTEVDSEKLVLRQNGVIIWGVEP